MSDVTVTTAYVKTTLSEIAKQASVLGAGLQNAAPGNKEGRPNHSVQYLLDVADLLSGIAEDCGKLLSPSSPQ